MPRGDLFPDIAPYETGLLPLSPASAGAQGDIPAGPSGGIRHLMYWEQVGNPRGQPVLFLHGGPGAGAGAVHRRFFDPHHWRAVIFDQRGAGRSRPLGELRENSTAHLVEDIETLRRFLGIERWLLFGGSWGSTLALAYAQAHPERVVGCVLRGVFLGRRSEVEWFLYGLRRVFPDAWAGFAEHVPPAERHDLLGAYLRRLCDPDPAVHLPAARAWSNYEGLCSTLMPSPELVASFAQDRSALGLARIEAYYFANALFLPPEKTEGAGPGGLLGEMGRIAHIPAEIVQGRYDMVCPPVSAFELLDAWPSARLTVVPDEIGRAHV